MIASSNIDAARSSRILFIFPFYLTPRRMRYWSVIPFGRQTDLTIIVHEENPQLDRLLDPGKNGTVSFTNFIENAFSNDGFIYFLSGYVQEELVTNLLRANLGVTRKLALVKQNVSELDEIPMLLYRRYPFSELNQSSVFFCDPGRFSEVKDKLRRGFKIFSVPHNIDVQVGIGFSLLTLPTLMKDEFRNDLIVKDDIWNGLINFCYEQFRPYSEQFASQGIRLLVPDVVQREKVVSLKLA